MSDEDRKEEIDALVHVAVVAYEGELRSIFAAVFQAIDLAKMAPTRYQIAANGLLDDLKATLGKEAVACNIPAMKIALQAHMKKYQQMIGC